MLSLVVGVAGRNTSYLTFSCERSCLLPCILQWWQWGLKLRSFTRRKVQTYSKQIDKFFNIENEFWPYAVAVFLISFRGQLFTPSDVTAGLSISERLWKSQQCTRPGINKQICRWGNNYKPLGRWLKNKNRSRKSKGNFVLSLVYVQGYLSIGKRETWVIAK